ncbi:hypothetical protein [Fibrivirga algicola]|uniref:Uncharacterized protein n=1 Tax=Fibrivirga algicola TaxID=2950420 RepID=A0ABX0QR16_9BACT|nr:hypothetical protein [Fibrivirga algicola]ARK11801.1 hypothetical protein A6C57_16495 [Fibrella sp. ES10-3-2-2]NID13307.1 hypothetical protein [Fibrivirga algicola]
MSEKVSNDLFDLKNDPRLSVYLYRTGFGCWLLYIMAGAPIMASLRFYRTDLGILSFFMMISGLTASMVYDYHHNTALFMQKKKWLAIGYCLLAGLIYFVVLGHKSPTLPNWLSF